MKREVEEIKDSEALEKDEAALCRLLAALECVEAPANFDRRVMTKIAAGPERSRRKFGLPLAIAYGLPLLLIVVVVAGYFINSVRSPQTTRIIDQAGAVPVSNPTVERQSVDDNFSRPNDTIVASSSPDGPKNPAVSSTVPKAVGSPKVKKEDVPRGGSFDRTVVERKAITPLGVGNQNSSVPPGGIITTTSLPIREVLSVIGISADYRNGWVVNSVTPNNKAERSGVKVGDVILSLGKTVLSANTEYKGKVEFDSIRIRRGGQEIDLALK